MASNFRLDELIRRYPPREKKQKKATKGSAAATYQQQLCWDCASACGGCEWSDHLEPVPGWDATPHKPGAEGRRQRQGRHTGSILVCDPRLPQIQEGHTMMRLVIDIYDGEDTQGTKEAMAMLLEPLGRVRVVQVIIDGKEEKR